MTVLPRFWCDLQGRSLLYLSNAFHRRTLVNDITFVDENVRFSCNVVRLNSTIRTAVGNHARLHRVTTQKAGVRPINIGHGHVECSAFGQYVAHDTVSAVSLTLCIIYAVYFNCYTQSQASANSGSNALCFIFHNVITLKEKMYI
jgi:hypothetical protein